MLKYEKGDIVTIEAIRVRKNRSLGRMLVQIVKHRDGLYFKPFLLKDKTAIPVSVIDYFDPTWLMEGCKESRIEAEERIRERGIEVYELLWEIVWQVWSMTKIAARDLNIG